MLRVRMAALACAATAVCAVLPAGAQAAAPCNVNWVGPSGGDWNTPANWSTDAVPVEGADVCIETASTVVLDDTDASPPTLGSLDVGGNSGASAQLDVAIHDVVVSNATTIGANAGVVLDGTYHGANAGDASLGGGTVDNLGTITMEGSGYNATLYGTVTNQGTIDVPNGTESLGQGSNGGSGSLLNEGTINISSTSSNPSNPPVLKAIAFPITNAGGTINNQGEFDVYGANGVNGGYTQGNGTETGNALQIGANAPITYTGGGASGLNVTVSNAVTGSLVAGQSLQANIGTVLTATASMTNAGSITLDGSYHGSGGGNAAFGGGSGVTITNTGTITMRDGATLYGTVVNQGTIADTDGAAVFGSGSNGPTTAPVGTLTNTGTISTTAASNDPGNPAVLSAISMPVLNDGGTITNAGTFNVSGANGINGGYTQGAGTETGNSVEIGANAPIGYAGAGASSIEVHDGNALTGNISAGQTLQMDIGVTVTAPSSFTNAGSIILNGTYYGGGGGPAGIALSSGTLTNSGSILTESSATLAGDLDNTGTITMQPSSTLEQTSGTFTTDGTLVPEIASTGYGELKVDSGAGLAIGGTLTPTLESAFTPKKAQEIDVIYAPKWKGTFASVGSNWKPDFNTKSQYIGVIYQPGYRYTAAPVAPAVRKIVVSSGTVKLTLACGPAACARYKAVVSVTEHLKGSKLVAVTASAAAKTTRKAKEKTKVVTIGSASGLVATGRSATVTITLDATGKKLLARYHKLKAVVTVTAGGKKVAGKTVSITAAKKKATTKKKK